jgi:uncharacterized protein YbcI
VSETQGQDQQAIGVLSSVSNAMVALHKEQFGRGPTRARSNFAGPDTLVCVLEDALLPAERKLVELGDEQRVRDSRTAFQAATENEFIAAVEAIVHRKVRAFASGIDAASAVVFETFVLESAKPASGDGASGSSPA